LLERGPTDQLAIHMTTECPAVSRKRNQHTQTRNVEPLEAPASTTHPRRIAHRALPLLRVRERNLGGLDSSGEQLLPLAEASQYAVPPPEGRGHVNIKLGRCEPKGGCLAHQGQITLPRIKATRTCEHGAREVTVGSPAQAASVSLPAGE